jgi:hypothetical protein
MESLTQEEHQKKELNTHSVDIEKKLRIKEVLREENPKKFIGLINRLESSQGKVDEYISRIMGIKIQVITTIRNWNRIIKKIIIDEGREVLDAALLELEQELYMEKILKNREVQKDIPQNITFEGELQESKEEQKTEVEKTQNIPLQQVNLNSKEDNSKMEIEEEENQESLISQELAMLNKRALDRKKTAVEILLNEDVILCPPLNSHYDHREKLSKEAQQEIISPPIACREEIIDLSLQQEDIILSDIENAPLGTSQREINDTKEYWRKQLEHAVANHKELKGSSLEASLWAPNENTCEGLGEYIAKISAVNLPGENSEERIKFVKGTLHRSSHISKIEECFMNGNSWVVISFDCHKGLELLKEKLKKKEIEWYRVIFEENKITHEASSRKDSSKIKGQDPGENSHIDTKLSSKSKPKGKNKDFIWITIWDLPLEYSKQEICRLIKHFGYAEEIRVQRQNFFQVAEVKIFIQREEQERKIKANWAIGLENGKLARMTIGSRNKDFLKERENFRAVLTNVPKTAQETLLLRALQVTGAKTVYIPYNSNRNPSRVAKVFFNSKEDLERALKRNIFYYNTKLYWKENIPHSQKRVEVWESSKIKKRNSLPLREEEVTSYGLGEKQGNENLEDTIDLQKIKKKVKQVQSKSENNLDKVLDKILSRLESLEGERSKIQRVKLRSSPNRS